MSVVNSSSSARGERRLQELEGVFAVAWVVAPEERLGVVVRVWATHSGEPILVFMASASSKCRAAASWRPIVVVSRPSGRAAEPWQNGASMTTQRSA